MNWIHEATLARRERHQTTVISQMHQRVVSRIPLANLWNAAGELNANRVRHLMLDDLRELLRQGPAPFVVANIGEPLTWMERCDAYEFWKEEAKSHIAAPDGFRLEDYPGNYCYVASEWHLENGRVIVLEKHH